MSTAVEHRETFACFGGGCTVIVAGDRAAGAAAGAAAAQARARLLEWHDRFTRFDRGSELERLNADPRATVPVSPIMRRVVEEAIRAAAVSGGLIDPTLGDEIVRAGYDGDLPAPVLTLRDALARAPERRPAAASSSQRWRLVHTSRADGTVSRPPGIHLDAGGIAKGVFADELAAALHGYEAFVVDCCGDLRLGGSGALTRPVHVADPFDGAILHTFELSDAGVATSGIGRRSWIDPAGGPAHHLLDPATGRPAFTGLVQVTALAPTAAEAEMRSKAALLSGPGGARRWLPHGGVVVANDGSHTVV
jgi:thiamine biosynthesis lipoprotein